MILFPEHKLEFEYEDGTQDDTLPMVSFPTIFYKKGDKIYYTQLLELDEPHIVLEVVDVRHELSGILATEQVTVITVRKIEEESNDTKTKKTGAK